MSPSAAYALAKPSVPDEAFNEVIEIAESGHNVTHAEAREIIAKHKPTPVESPPVRVIPDLFADEDKTAQEAVELGQPVETEDTPDDPTEGTTETDFDLSPDAVTQCEKNAEAWGKIISNYAYLVNSIRRRGGIATLARPWPKAKIRDASQVCGDVIEAFTSYKKDLKELLK